MNRLRHCQIFRSILLWSMLGFASLPTNPAAKADPVVPTSSQSPTLAPIKPVQVNRFLTPDAPYPERVAKAQLIETFKMDGLTGNRAHIADMIMALKEPTGMLEGPSNEYAAWLALSRLGATEAIPAMDAALKRPYYSPNTKVGEFAHACRARLLAETEATPHGMALRYFKELGETPKQIDATVAKSDQQEAAHPDISVPLSWKVLRAKELLADMIYHGPAAELLSDSLVKQIDFKRKYSWNSALKIDLALLTPDQQCQKLIELLGRSNAIGEGVASDQLLIDLGRPKAIELLTDKLKDVKDNPSQYPTRAARNLSYFLYMAGDTSQEPNGFDKYEIRQLLTDY